MILTLVRHGQSEGNVERRIRGWGGGSLTPQGRQEAALTGYLLAKEGPFQALYSSPLNRALETANIIGERLSLRPLVLSDLRELNVGLLDGLTRDQAEAAFPGLVERWRQDDPSLAFPQGEGVAEFHQRARRSFQRIAAAHLHGRVLVVSHVCLISAYLTQLLEDKPSVRLAWKLWNCSITQLEFADGAVSLKCLNDHAHLDHLYPDKT